MDTKLETVADSVPKRVILDTAGVSRVSRWGGLVNVNYHGIALQSVVLKVFCKVLNARLSDWSETNCIKLDEQNGFT